MSEQYRYSLSREVADGDGRRVLFVMLNPSTADATRDDPTVRKCVGFARRWGYSQLLVGNLFALRSTDPRALIGAPAGTNLVGPYGHDQLIGLMCIAQLIVAAWGAHVDHARLSPRASVVRSVIEMYRSGGTPVVALGLTKGGHPRHPLYAPYGRDVAPWPVLVAP